MHYFGQSAIGRVRASLRYLYVGFSMQPRIGFSWAINFVGSISHDRTILICHSPAVLSGRIAKVPTTRTKSKGLVSGPASSFLGFPPRQPGRAYWMPYW